MGQLSLAALKAKWVTGYIPTQADFIDFFDSYMNSITGNGHYIGESFGGGIIFALWRNAGVEHGFIISKDHICAERTWSNIQDVSSGALNEPYSDGLNNTNLIVAQAGHTDSCAQECLDYSVGGFDDWYLPAKWQLELYFRALLILKKITGFVLEIGGIACDSELLWSSSEDSDTNAWMFDSVSGICSSNSKANSANVRAIREF